MESSSQSNLSLTTEAFAYTPRYMGESIGKGMQTSSYYEKVGRFLRNKVNSDEN